MFFPNRAHSVARLMLGRKVGMFAVLCRSLHLSHRSVLSTAAFVPSFPTAVACSTICTSRKSKATAAGSTAQRRRLFLAASDTSSSNTNRTPRAEAAEVGGKGSSFPRRKGGRGMSSAAYGGRRRGASGRGNRGGRGARSPPDYGPDRAGQHRTNVSPGSPVEVVQKQHQRTGQLTQGTVSRLLTSAGFHPRGIKVMLAGGVVGRVQNIVGIDGPGAGPKSAGSEMVGGYSSSSGSSSGGGIDISSGPTASTSAVPSVIGTGRKRRVPVDGATPSDANLPTSGARAAGKASHARPARPVRAFRAERVQGRSWSLEGGELVTRGAGGEEIRGAGSGVDAGGGVDPRRGRGGKGRGRR